MSQTLAEPAADQTETVPEAAAELAPGGVVIDLRDQVATVQAAQEAVEDAFAGIGFDEEGFDRPTGGGAPMGAVRGLVSLAIVMPVYNEERTVLRAIEDVLAIEFPCEIQLIVVDDGSTDATPELIAGIQDPRLMSLRHTVNRGKGAALRTGAAAADATHIVPFDADLEYSAADLARLVEPVLAGRADIVYGTRVCHRRVDHRYTIYALGNSIMTGLANLLYGSAITDLHTCLKLMPLDVMRSLPLTQEGFGLDTEMTAWLLRFRLPLCEVSVSYQGRTRAEGKKITWRDGLECLHVLGSVRLARTVPLSLVQLRSA